MYPPLWISLRVAMNDDMENRSIFKMKIQNFTGQISTNFEQLIFQIFASIPMIYMIQDKYQLNSKLTDHL